MGSGRQAQRVNNENKIRLNFNENKEENKIVNKKSYQHRAVVMGISVLLPPNLEKCTMNDEQ